MGRMKYKGDVQRAPSLPTTLSSPQIMREAWVHICHVTDEVRGQLTGPSFHHMGPLDQTPGVGLISKSLPLPTEPSHWPVTDDHLKIFGNRGASVLGRDLLLPCLPAWVWGVCSVSLFLLLQQVKKMPWKTSYLQTKS